MLGMQRGDAQPIERALPHAVPGVLHAAGVERATEPTACGGDAGGDRAPQRRAWPGRNFGIRRPEHGETPLSRAEVEFAEAQGLLDDLDNWPTVRVHRPVGTWEGTAPVALSARWKGLS